MAAIEIGVGVDSRAAKRGLETGLIEPLEDIDKALDDLAKNKSGDKLEDSLEGAQKATKALERETKQTADVIEREYKKSYAAVKNSADDAFDKAKSGADEAKDEIKSSAREGAASFSGEFDDVGDFIQESLANAFEGFGPAGQAAGIAAAVGIGLIFAELTKTGERAEAVREQVKGITDQLFEVEGNTELLDYVQQLRDFLDKPAAGDDLVSQFNDFFEQSGTNFDQAKRDAEEYGVALTDLLRAYSGGDAQAAQEVLEDLAAAQKKASDAAHDAGNRQDMKGYRAEADAIQLVIDKIKDQNNLTDEAVSQYELISQATDEMAAAQEYAAAKIDAVADAASSLQGELDEAVNGFSAFADAEGNLDPAGYVASIGARIAATSDFNSNVQNLATQFGLTNEEMQTILDQGLDFAPMLQGIIDSGLAPEFVSQVQNAVGGGRDILAGNPLTTSVGVEADTDPAAAGLDILTGKPRETEIKVKTDTKPAETALDAVASKSRTASIGVNVSTSAAENALSNFINRSRTITVTVRTADANGRPLP